MPAFLLWTLLPLSPLAQAADISSCARLQAEAAEMASRFPSACEEAKETFRRFTGALPELRETCARLEAEASQETAGNLTVAVALDTRLRHLRERKETSDRILQELLRTPLDRGDAAQPPLPLGETCEEELEALAKFRRSVLSEIGVLYGRLSEKDDDLLRRSQLGEGSGAGK